MLQQKTFAVFLLGTLCLAFSGSVNGEIRHAIVEHKVVKAEPGSNIKLSCGYSASLLSCDIQVPGYFQLRLNPIWERNDTFRYFGEGLDKGHCGVEILSVDEIMNGMVTCVMYPNGPSPAVTGNINLIVAKVPKVLDLELTKDAEYFEAGQDIKAVCTSVDGFPAANLTWFINENPLGPGQLEVSKRLENNLTLFTAQSTLTYRLNPEDNNANLICRESHRGHPDEAGNLRDVVKQLTVKFPPVPQADIEISSLEIKSSAKIGPITVHANPQPTVQWIIEGRNLDQTIIADRYIGDLVPVEGERWNASLQLNNMSVVDDTRSVLLRASNEFGTTDYRVNVKDIDHKNPISRLIVDSKFIVAQVGSPVHLLCRFTASIKSCAFNLPGVSAAITLSPELNTESFKYFGNGTASGHCGISILKFQKEMFGNASCHLGVEDGKEVAGKIQIFTSKAPEEMAITMKNRIKLIAGNEIKPECLAVDGRLTENLSWFIDDQLLGSGDIEIVKNLNDESTTTTVRSTLKYTLKPEDHSKTLSCVATHPHSFNGTSFAKIQLFVNFRPVPHTDFQIYGLKIGNSAVIGPITIEAGLRPTFTWTVQGEVLNKFYSGKFSVIQPVLIDVNRWNTSMYVGELTSEDLRQQYQLKVVNQFGSTDYIVKLFAGDFS